MAVALALSAAMVPSFPLGATSGQVPASRAGARTVNTPQATVEFITGTARPKAGETIWLGLRFRLAEGWHIYWQNPGDSGGPPTLQWTLPQGFTAGEFTWPAPERMPFGRLVNYGYEGDVTLPVPVKVPADYRGGPITLNARARWLACKELCVSQRGDLALSLPLSAGDEAMRAGWQQRIAAARAAAPPPAPRTWRARATEGKDDFVLRVQMDRPATGAAFFPLEVSQINDSARQRVETSGRTLTLTLRKSDQLAGVPRTLRGVLSLASGGAFIIEAPVEAGASR